MEENSIDREVAITTIANLIKTYNIQASDIPQFNSEISNLRDDLVREQHLTETLSTGGHALYTRLCEMEGDEGAYEWAESELDPQCIECFDINKPKRYKHIEGTVTRTFNLIVPDSWDEYQINDYIEDNERDWELEISVDTEDEGLTEEQARNLYSVENSISDFDDSDWD